MGRSRENRWGLFHRAAVGNGDDGVWVGFGLVGRAEAGIWLQTPAGLAPGDAFRFAFLTGDATVATSTNISFYNNFVNTEAGGATYQRLCGQVGRDRLDVGGQRDRQCRADATAVYLPDGTEVTTSTTSSGLWSGGLLNPINETISGAISSHLIWTGTSESGNANANSSWERLNSPPLACRSLPIAPGSTSAPLIQTLLYKCTESRPCWSCRQPFPNLQPHGWLAQ